VLLDDSLRSPCGPPFGRSTRYALLSGIRRNDERSINQTLLKLYWSGSDVCRFSPGSSYNRLFILDAVHLNPAGWYLAHYLLACFVQICMA
jgi:hypothetical protein